jgi:hypothetical protein
MDAPLRDGWERSFNGTYNYFVDNGLRGYVVGMPDGYGWLGGILTNGRGTDPHMCHTATIEEAMIWVETTYALLE